MRKRIWIILLVILVVCAAINSREENDSLQNHEFDNSEVATQSTTANEITEVIEPTEVLYWGINEIELEAIEHCMSVSGWNYDRSHFERVYRLKDNEMTLNPATYAEYEVTIKDGKTHNVTLNKSLIGE